MTDNKTHNDSVLFDRLVDGELTGIERRQLLESLDKRPEGWRSCALAFLEAQSWREELGQVARSVHSESAVPKSLSSGPDSHNPKSHWAAGAKWLALAASLLLAFGLGWMQHDRGHSVASGSLDPSGKIASVTRSNTSTPPKAPQADAVTLYVRDNGGHMQPVRVPLVDARTLDQQLGVQFQTGLPDSVRDQMKNRGYNVESKRQYAPLWLENGRPMILPVEDTKIMPVSNKVY